VPSLVIAAAALLGTPARALAHVGSGSIGTDYEARVVGIRPLAPWLSPKVLDGDQRLQLSVPPPHVVIVRGDLGEPFLRFSPSGVAVNLGSPTATAAHVLPPSQAAVGGVRWRHLPSGHVFAWHENRLRPEPVTGNVGDGPRRVAGWAIPLMVDGRRAALTGNEWFAPAPSPWPWMVVALAGLAAAVLVALRASERTRRATAYALLPPVVGALLAGWLGIFLAGRASALTLAFAALFITVSAVFAGIAVAACAGPARAGVVALVGGFAAAFAVPELPAFVHGFVLSALPAWQARLMVVVALSGGLAIGIVCAPTVAAVLDVSPTAALESPARLGGPSGRGAPR
jgi:hypothetical protein